MDNQISTLVLSEEKAGQFTIGYVALNNPRALNAIDLEMFQALGRMLLEWRQKQDLACVVFHADSERAFCAGGDVKALVMGLQGDGSVAAAGGSISPQSILSTI